MAELEEVVLQEEEEAVQVLQSEATAVESVLPLAVREVVEVQQMKLEVEEVAVLSAFLALAVEEVVSSSSQALVVVVVEYPLMVLEESLCGLLEVREAVQVRHLLEKAAEEVQHL